MKKNNLVKIICFPIMLVLMVALIVGDVIAASQADSITGILCPPIIDSDALLATRESGQALSKQIVEEGCVLVKNNDSALPLDTAADTKVNVFGRASTDWVYGGSGSGQVVPENDNISENVDLLEALDLYGIEYYKDLPAMYKKFLSPVGDIGSISTYYQDFYKLGEPDITDKKCYSDTLLDGAKAFSDIAIVVIGRRGGETEDPPRRQYKYNAPIDGERHYLEISTEEESLLRYVGETYEKVIVLVNAVNTIELDFLDTIPGLDACLVVGGTGTRGASGIPYVLYGEVSPSGRFTDTYAYDMSSNINYNFTGFDGIGHYTNGSELYPTDEWSNAGVTTRLSPAYVDYVEGIYVGYKWYETADAENLWAGETREILDADGKKVTARDYEAVVQYPFGFGMSYTDFDWAVQEITPSPGAAVDADTEITVSVRVTNRGGYTGKDVVEIYLTPEYKNGIEKSHVTLVGFGKTADIDPGKSQTLEIKIAARDFASYDCYGLNDNDFKGYEMEKGKYRLKLMTDAHTVKTVNFDGGAENAEGIVEYNVAETIKLDKDKYSQATVSNKFTGGDAADGASLDGSDSEADIPFISRKNFPKTLEKPADREMTGNIKKLNLYTKNDADAWDGAATDIFGKAVEASDVTFGETGDLKVYANGAVTELGYKLGSDYGAPEWDALLDQVSLDEAMRLVSGGSFGNAEVASIGKPKLADYDGPAQCRSFNAGTTRGTGFPNATVIAQTWSIKLAYDFGLNYAKEMDALGVDGVYGFACNLHRSPFAGRNYEYYSEDAFLSSIMITNAVKALKNGGKYTYLKHFAIQEVETERDSLYTWLSEQALRELYLKPFQKAIQEGGCVGLMSSYNRIGHVWTGGSEALLTGVLRDEWGFNGSVVTDYADIDKYMNLDQALRAGGDLGLGVQLNSTFTVNYAKGGNRIHQRLRDAVKHVTYMWLSSKYVNSQYNASVDVGDQIINSSVRASWVWWIPALIDLNIFVFAGCGVWAFFLLTYKKKVPAEANGGANAADEKGGDDEN